MGFFRMLCLAAPRGVITAVVVASTVLISIPKAIASPNLIETSQNPVDTEKADLKDAPGAIAPSTTTDSLADVPDLQPTATPEETEVAPPSGMEQVIPASQLSTDSLVDVPDLQPTAIPEEIEVSPASGMEQVTSVTQLRDVQPTDWAFEALRSLVERYGCIAGYPDRTFRGNRALSRYEFAAGLNACLDRLTELMATNTADLVKKEDLETLRKLQEDFTAELTTLRSRVDTLEARTATLEQQQFSPTTRLSVTSFFNITSAFSGGDVKFESLPGPGGSVPDAAPNGFIRLAGRDAAGNPLVQRTNKAEPTFSFRNIIRFNTSFTGKDFLQVRMIVGNGNAPVNQFASAGFYTTFGNPASEFTPFGAAIGEPDVVMPGLFYSFPVGNSIQVTVGPRIDWYFFFDVNRFTSYLDGGAASIDSSNNPLTNAIFFGPGAIIQWNINKQLLLMAGYQGESSRFGLFNGTNTSTAELTFTPNKNFALRLLYVYSNLRTFGGQLANKPLPYGFADAGSGFSVFDPATGAVSEGGLNKSFAHTFTANFEWLVTPGFGLFGRYGYGTTTLKPIDQVINTQCFQLGVAFPDLGKKGATGIITFQMPMDILKGRKYFVAGGGDGGTMYELEGSYSYPITDNLAVVPTFYAIFNPNNFDSNPNIYVGHLRFTFNF
jgi:hypothetical protein